METENQKQEVDFKDEVTPISSKTNIQKQNPCSCSKEEEQAELDFMISLFKDAVQNARSLGYQAGNDPGYSDPGLGFHKVGNCADWQQVSWSAIVTRTWKCWNVFKIRARKHWTVFTFHHFVRLESVCSIRKRNIYLDPWQSGNPDFWDSQNFPFADGVDWGHTVTKTHSAGAAPRDPGND